MVVLTADDSCFNLRDVEDDYGTNYRSVFDPPRRFTIYFGEKFNKNNIPCDPLDEGFILGAYLEEKIIFRENIIKLVEDYADYSQLKQDLGLDNFAFEFKELDGNVITELSVIGKIPSSVDIVSKDFPVRVIDENAQISELILNIKAWR